MSKRPAHLADGGRGAGGCLLAAGWSTPNRYQETHANELEVPRNCNALKWSPWGNECFEDILMVQRVPFLGLSLMAQRVPFLGLSLMAQRVPFLGLSVPEL